MSVAPHNATQWVACPGSVSLQAAYPASDENNERKLEGRAAHWVGDRTLISWREAALGRGDVVTPEAFLGIETPGGVIVTEEIVEAVGVYVRAVWDRASNDPDGLKTEKQVSPLLDDRFKFAPPGRIDALWISGEFASVHDFKFGRGEVDLDGDWQLPCYALGVAVCYPSVQRIELVLVAPCGMNARNPVQRKILTREQVIELGHTIERSAYEAQGLSLEATPTRVGDHCRYCSALHACPAASRAASAAVEFLDNAVPVPLDDNALGFEIKLLETISKLLGYRVDAGRDEALRRLSAGKTVPGYAVDTPLSDRKWRNPGAAKAAAAALGVSLIDEKIVTPAEAERRGLDKALIGKLTKRDHGKPKLTTAAKVAKKARKAFA